MFTPQIREIHLSVGVSSTQHALPLPGVKRYNVDVRSVKEALFYLPRGDMGQLFYLLRGGMGC